MKHSWTSEAAKAEHEDWQALVGYMRFLPQSEWHKYSQLLRRLRTAVSKRELDDLAQSNLAANNYRELENRERALFGILQAIMTSCSTPEHFRLFEPHVRNLKRLLEEQDAPEYTDKQAREDMMAQLAAALPPDLRDSSNL